MKNFDRIYDPPESPEPSPQSERIVELLEAANVAQSVIDAVVDQVSELEEVAARLAASNCPVCEAAAVKAEEEAERAAEEYWNSLPAVTLCPHMRQAHECNACLVAGDLAYDAARERRMFSR